MLEPATLIGIVFGCLPDVALDCESDVFAWRFACAERGREMLAEMRGLL